MDLQVSVDNLGYLPEHVGVLGFPQVDIVPREEMKQEGEGMSMPMPMPGPSQGGSGPRVQAAAAPPGTAG